MADRFIDTTNTLGTVTDTDSLYFVKGNVEVTTNLDQSGLTTGLTAVHVARPWTGNIGQAATPFKADVDVGVGRFRYDAGGGVCFYQPAGNNNVCTLLQAYGRGQLVLVSAGTVTTLEVGDGDVIVGGSVVVPTLRIGGGNVQIENSSGTAPTTVEIAAGTLTTVRGITTLSLYGGTVIFKAGINAITTLTMGGGALQLWETGTITTFNLIAGDASNIFVARPITITTLNIWGTVANASALTDNPLLTISTTNWRIRQGSRGS